MFFKKKDKTKIKEEYPHKIKFILFNFKYLFNFYFKIYKFNLIFSFLAYFLVYYILIHTDYFITGFGLLAFLWAYSYFFIKPLNSNQKQELLNYYKTWLQKSNLEKEE